MVAQLREIHYPVRLTLAEFVFLVTLFDAKRIPGISSDALPEDLLEREPLFNQGQQAMINDGWLVAQQPTGYVLHPDLTLMGAVIAEAPTFVLTEQRLKHGLGGLFNYLKDDLIVELTPTEPFELTMLNDLEIAVSRIGNALQITHQPIVAERFQLTTAELEQLQNTNDPRLLLERGISATGANLFLTILQNPHHTASVNIGRAIEGYSVGIESIGLLVGADGVILGVSPIDENNSEYFLDNLQGFVNRVIAMIGRVRSMEL